MVTEPSWAAQATASRWPLESRANAMAVVEPPGGAIEPICDPSPASQPAVSWITIGAPWAAIVAIRRPVTEVARRRAPAGPSPISPVVVSTIADVGAAASPVTTATRSPSIQTGGAATTDRSSVISNAVWAEGSTSTTRIPSPDSRSPASVAKRPPSGSQVAK